MPKPKATPGRIVRRQQRKRRRERAAARLALRAMDAAVNGPRKDDWPPPFIGGAWTWGKPNV